MENLPDGNEKFSRALAAGSKAGGLEPIPGRHRLHARQRHIPAALLTDSFRRHEHNSTLDD
jgi:hypothetical protein